MQGTHLLIMAGSGDKYKMFHLVVNIIRIDFTVQYS